MALVFMVTGFATDITQRVGCGIEHWYCINVCEYTEK
ncbi:hypothetical protein DDB_G0294350 [Dictyostelium discoideum AX4]|nr:hypothetical protein DDB_G0294350 [Dictyostelium discoideum AX4]EAL60311.1 hypothetical protein DDB_G0294350 [Dictyostelium discoideum AX4]|eukprot:XP_628724.1 hypothetical protein DDB_G0294350 [Dictyostelium discoideum AX4]